MLCDWEDNCGLVGSNGSLSTGLIYCEFIMTVYVTYGLTAYTARLFPARRPDTRVQNETNFSRLFLALI